MISKSKNAKNINECINRINIQCVRHCGKSFLFPDDGIYGEYGGPFEDEISWSLHKKWNGIFSIGRIGQREAMLIERESFKKKISNSTGLICENISKNRTYSNGPVMALRIIVTEAYSKKIYLNRLKELSEESIIVDSSNNNNSILENAKAFRMRIKQYNDTQVLKLAEIAAKTFGQTFITVKKDSIDICKGYIKDIEKTVSFSDIGLETLEEDFQLYALSIELANQISSIKRYPNTQNDKNYFVELKKFDKNYRISLGYESVFNELKKWGEN